MSDYRRWRVEGGTYFFTLVAHGRVPLFADPTARTILGDKFRECQRKWPFEINAIVLLPEHLHAIWTLPSGDANYSRRWAWIKKEFTKDWLALGGSEQKISTRGASAEIMEFGSRDSGNTRSKTNAISIGTLTTCITIRLNMDW